MKIKNNNLSKYLSALNNMFFIENEQSRKKNNKIMPIILCIMFISTLLLGINNNIAGDDYWWHIKIGEWIVQNKAVPMTGIYSWFGENLNWFAHEWGAEIILYMFSNIINPNIGGVIYLYTFITILGLLIFYMNKDDFLKNPIIFIFWASFGAICVRTVGTARPHIMSVCLFTLLINECYKIENNNTYMGFFKYIPFAIIFANIHGGSTPLLYCVPFMFFCAHFFNFKIGRLESKKIEKNWRYLVFALINLLSIIINPRGLELLTYPFSYSNEHAQYIQEWQAISLKNAPFIIVLIIFICIVFFLTNKPNLRFQDMALVGVFMIFSLRSIRFCLWLYIAASFVVFKYITKSEKAKEINGLTFIFVITLSILIRMDIGTSYISTLLPQEAIDVLKENHFERLYNDYNLGSELIYNDIPVFIDGRADMYQNISFTKSVNGKTNNAKYTSEEFIDEYNFDGFVLPIQSHLARYLVYHSDMYETIYENDDYCIIKPINN